MARRQAHMMIVEHAVFEIRHHLLSTHTLQVADGLCMANLDTVDDDTAVDGQAGVGNYCEVVLCARMD
eukprot:10283023-Lingulodinium_polyedra.AAC.1